MNDFAIIAEGKTDQPVIMNILLGALSTDDDEPTVVYEQPPLDATGERTQPAFAGWSLVLKYFETGRYRQALQFNRYLIIHIDTDVAERLGIARQEEGQDLSVSELTKRVVAKLRGLIDEEVLRTEGARFLFAVAVDSTECWLLPLFFRADHKANLLGKTTGCLHTINRELLRLNQRPLSTGEGPSERKHLRRYDEVSRPFRKRKELQRCALANQSLGLFVEALTISVSAEKSE